MQNILKGKKGLILGLANNKSIAYGIAKACSEQGAELALTYQNEILAKRVGPIAEELGIKTLIECDVVQEESLDNTFAILAKQWDKIDFVVHAIGFSDKDELRGSYMNTSKQNFLNTMDVSCYSLTSIAKRAAAMMKDGGSIITLTYYGSEKTIPNYNVMGVAKAALEASVRYMARDLGPQGIRVNSLSAGPIKTLAASGIGDFRSVLAFNERNAPLRRNTSLEDVAGTALYLLSDLSAGVTGELLHVDSGYHVIGMPMADELAG